MSSPAYPTDDRREEVEQTSVGELIGNISNDLSTLFRQEVELAKAELKQEASKAGKAAGMLGAAGYAGHLMVVLLSFALVFALGLTLPGQGEDLASLLSGLVVLLLAALAWPAVARFFTFASVQVANLDASDFIFA